ncbi:immunoglobulin kappa light chain isoform X1 [Pleuronectes platessa]|uniref:immunoglobulin kappa light chain isoform X1 n=1 Tax=Pleuronectes platessa TaxID=8262 RepID=UPI00232A5D59|nr:immunoglobulin kappa light chain isoform X1 [Pleuronectes platessa]
MKTSPKFVLYLTCFFLGKMVQMHHYTLSHQDSGFISADVGDNLTFQCFYEGNDENICWYKHTPGQKPRIISKTYKFSKDFPLLNEFKDNQRFTVETNDLVSRLNISDLKLSDSATYYCLKDKRYVYDFMEGVTVSVKGSGFNIQAVVHQSESIQPGGSVTLSCTVHTGTCDGEHSVYWFKNSEEPQPGLIYTQGDRNHQCERKPDNQTHTCVYNLSMERLNHSNAGTYYCAVAACGHIVFGDGTKMDFEEVVDYLPLVYFLSGALVFTTILVVSLAYTAQRALKTNFCQGSESQAAAAALNVEQGHQDEDNPHYAALMEHSFSRARRQTDRDGSECVYTSVKQ